MNPWWTNQDAGLIGGISGAVIGLLGASLGLMSGVFAPRGKHKALVLGLAKLMIFVGIVATLAGCTALVMHQPYAVWYPLLLIGFVCAIAAGSAFPAIRKRYQEAENRRLEAENP